MASTNSGGIFDSLAKFYVSIAIIWTVALLAGAVFLIINRREQCVRIRNLPLALSAVSCLHVYWILCMVAYSMGTAYPCAVEYWVMSVYLPLGIALFQANSMQLLNVFGIQEKLLYAAQQSYKPQLSASARHSSRYLSYWRQMNLVQRTEFGIAVGMGAQLILSLSVYLTSRKFHDFGTFSEAVGPEECRRGPEWQDSRPDGKCALHSSTEAWASVNRYWVPPLWFAPGIITMEAVTIFFPCYEVVSSRWHRDRILGEIEAWNEKKTNAMDESRSGTSRSNSELSRVSELYSLKALEKCLEDDSSALLQFAASKEFSGENIVFLNYVRDWKASWARTTASNPEYDWNRDPRHYRLHFFKVAVEIYTVCVNLKTAEFPINIESRVYSNLTEMFGEAVPVFGQLMTRGAATRREDDTSALCLDEYVRSARKRDS
ncbi:uncharacterized protein ATNIH1004_009510 [Aspergillus tanneri]|uniref:RGS domain-containing protein n=1 Tax=Aspergillus tanneri TaxID=1220188 RepID=A0A5M9M7I1_9EURO|nr:uncharacterized protein ATNIH1004_009510 [Aspergillus tanneri]KAA8642758.1 hypothetical protein ATNIH1004_009510 [Aspergillus tanneri]